MAFPGLARERALHGTRHPPSAGDSFLMNRKPLVPPNPFPVWTREPVPIALREVRHLCEVEQATVTRNLELIRQTPWHAHR